MTRSGQRARLLAAVVAGVAALVLLAALLPWELPRGPVARLLGERLGRPVEITRRLEVGLGTRLHVRLEGLVVGNPDWARDRDLLRVEAAQVRLRWLPLLRGRLEIEHARLTGPRLGLQSMADGRQTWRLGAQGTQGPMPVRVEALQVDGGEVHFLAPHLAADLVARLATDEGAGAAAMPLRFRVEGRWRGMAFQASGRTGGILALQSRRDGEPFPMEVEARAGATSLRANGTLASLAGFEGSDLQVRLQGRNLADLYPVAGLVLPATPPYVVAGRLQRQGVRWFATGLEGRLGRSDVTGRLTFDAGMPVPRLTGELASRQLDFDDLAPLVGLRWPPRLERVRAQREDGRVLPRVPLDTQRLRAMDADVRYTARRLVNVRQLPLDWVSALVRLQAGDLLLDPLEVGVAGGRLAGRLRVDGREPPATLEADLRAQDLQLPRLLPGEPLTRASAGQLQGRIQLSGRGAHLAQMLGRSEGEVSLLMGPGRISNLLLELAGLDGAEILAFLGGRDQQVGLRCAAAGFVVREGVMAARTLVLDTTDTVIWGEGRISLADETLALTFRPRPKDPSFLTLRSPLVLTGTLGRPQAGVDAGAVAARAGVALALGAINPLLGLAATVETGPGKDVDCAAVLRQAAAPAAAAPASGGRR